ncbi:DUF1801 domain-containing protein [Flavobacterium sp. SUN052]|uniref:DUF1801 domain-containing protein n=1 Tax=Flavobacterium sp. SUN052 TaxID=3002441 RepID=UPI00237E068F|nr:DUF1801 domain-containing protein [Flavobacterium sp. SUN052]MEC4003760.1 DUF1801 domain-containing protein [Flavobacterium sp. SUN052]
MNPNVATFLESSEKWQKELTQLRRIVLDCQLTEEIKWDCPCYTFKKNNVLMLGRFKDYCALSFFKGVLLNDANSVLISPGANSQSVRYIKFKSVSEIIELEQILKTYIYEAIEIEKAGLKVVKKLSSEVLFVEELQNKLNQDSEFKTAFESLTPGRQRAYNIYFSEAKQAKTRVLRIENYTQRILNRKGFNDCICGLSKRMPNCDGSHNNLNK